MPETVLRTGLTTYSTGTTGGTIPDETRIKKFTKWAKTLEPWKTPILTQIDRGMTSDTDPIYFGQSGRVNITSTVQSTFAQAATTLPVATGTGVIFQKYMVLEVTNYRSGSTTELDTSTRELIWVSGEPSTDNLTVVRAQGGTSDVAHPAASLIRVVGTAEPQLQFHTIAPVVRGFQFYNEFQRFEGGVKADKAAQNVPTWEHPGNPMLADFEEEQLKQKLLLELAVLYGGRQTGNPSTPVPAMMGGVRQYLTTNVTNVGGSALTKRVLEAELRDLAKTTSAGPGELTLFMSYDSSAIFDELLEPIRQATVSDTSVTLFTERVRFRWGTYNIAVSHNMPDGEIWGLNLKDLHVVTRKGLDWHTTYKRGEDHGSDHDERYTSADKSFMLEREQGMFRLHNFAQDLNQYGA